MEQKHSGIGIASFITSIVTAIAVFFTFIITWAVGLATPGGLDETSPAAQILGLLFISCLAVELVALGLGIGGLRQKERKKIFALLGALFSAVTIIGVGTTMFIGIMSTKPRVGIERERKNVVELGAQTLLGPKEGKLRW